jgi:glutamine amidotransferase
VTRITIFDYGAGNLHSLAKALAMPGVDVRIEDDPNAAIQTDALVLPGVGAFSGASARLAPGREAMRRAILDGLPTLGICLGMQLLLDDSDEGEGEGKGLGVVPGRVRKLRARRVPQIGWNEIETLDDGLPALAYFANSYVCEPEDEAMIVAYTTHETDRFASVISVAATVGVQFHPEKSSTAGVEFVHRFVRGVMA